MSESRSELGDFVSVLNDSLASILDRDRKVTHVSEEDLESKEYRSTDGNLIVDLKNGHKRVIVDAEEALALRRELGGVDGGRPIPFGVVGKAQDGSWWVLAEVDTEAVDGKEPLCLLSGPTVEAGLKRVADLAAMRGNRRIVFDEIARIQAFPMHRDVMTCMAIFAKDMDLEATHSLKWVQMTQDTLDDTLGKGKAQYLPKTLSLQDSLDTYLFPRTKPAPSLAGIAACPMGDPILAEVLEHIGRDTSYSGLLPWPRLDGIKYSFDSAYEQCVGKPPGQVTYNGRKVSMALTLLAAMPELTANLPKDHVAIRILSTSEGKLDKEQDFKDFAKIVGGGGFEATLAALLKMGGAHPAELGSIAITTWTHYLRPDVVLKCAHDILKEFTLSENDNKWEIDEKKDNRREAYFQTFIDQVFMTRCLIPSRYVRVDFKRPTYKADRLRSPANERAQNGANSGGPTPHSANDPVESVKKTLQDRGMNTQTWTGVSSNATSPPPSRVNGVNGATTHNPPPPSPPTPPRDNPPLPNVSTANSSASASSSPTTRLSGDALVFRPAESITLPADAVTDVDADASVQADDTDRLMGDYEQEQERPQTHGGDASGTGARTEDVMNRTLKICSGNVVLEYVPHVVIAHGKGSPAMLTRKKEQWIDMSDKSFQSISTFLEYEARPVVTFIFRLDPAKCSALDSSLALRASEEAGKIPVD